MRTALVMSRASRARRAARTLTRRSHLDSLSGVNIGHLVQQETGRAVPTLRSQFVPEVVDPPLIRRFHQPNAFGHSRTPEAWRSSIHALSTTGSVSPS